ncbi:MAG: hypothetical protein KAI47_17940 [Deltaproteobacteria bacterium]|nr:hypothetical protein [Deltaproteobacteria bacterium]
MKATVLVITLALALTIVGGGCAAMMQQWRVTHCNYDGAYKAGMNDATKGEEMKQAFSSGCFEKDRAIAEKGYREGYTIGLQSMRPQTPPPASGSGIHININ